MKIAAAGGQVATPEERRTEIPAYHLGGEGQTVLLSHATGFSGRVYTPLANELSSRFEVWAVDHRGHGQAGRPPGGDMGYESMAEDLLAIVDQLGGNPPAVFGHSMGGAVALLAERRRPGTFRAIYLYEPAIVPDDYALDGRLLAQIEAVRNRRDQFSSSAEAIAFFAGRDPYRRLRSDALIEYTRHGLEPGPDRELQLCCRPADEAACYAENRFTADDVAGVSAPVTLACGGEGMFGDGSANRMPVARALPGATIVQHPGLGHFGPLESPGTIALDMFAAFDPANASLVGATAGSVDGDDRQDDPEAHHPDTAGHPPPNRFPQPKSPTP